MRYRFIVFIAALKVAVLCVWIVMWGFNLDAVGASPEPAHEPKEAVSHQKSEAADASKEAEPKKDDSPLWQADEAEREKNLLSAIQRKEEDLSQREALIKVKEERLESIKTNIEEKIAELKKVKSEIEVMVKKVDQANDQRIKRIVKIYEAMSPEESAARLEKIDEPTAVSILSAMSEKKAAKILGLMTVDKSVKLSQSLKLK
ncbi:MAG: hypothetical protein AABZ23_02435 [Deltaproteobacteria bacterium]